MARKPKKAKTTLERKIHFYRVDAGKDATGAPTLFNPKPILAAIRQLPFSDDEKGRYLVDDDGNAICAWPDVSTTRVALRFCQVRRNGLPQIERAGKFDALNIAPDAGLLETVHVVFFENNIVGADFNFYGPRISRLGYYLQVKSTLSSPLPQFRPLLRQNVTQQLNLLNGISLFDFRIKASYVEKIRQANASLADAFAATASVLGDEAKEIQLILRVDRPKRSDALNYISSSIEKLVKASDLHENAKRFQVSGNSTVTGKTDVIDLLHDQLIVTRKMLRIDERSRGVDANSAYREIEFAYDTLKNDLQSASEVVAPLSTDELAL